MKVEYHRWFSPSLGRDMELKVYGSYGKPVLAFPAQGGHFFDFENFGMVDSVGWFLEHGRIKLFTVDSVDNESWANWAASPWDRAWRHEAYDAYIIQEVVPFVGHHCCWTSQRILSTGCSMGGYHAANFFFRHPDVFDATISLSGLFQLRDFVGDYVDERVYLNSPLLYLPNLDDPWFLERFRSAFIVICAGRGPWEDDMVGDALQMEAILASKKVPAWIDLWGDDVNHDWPWWQRQLPYFLSHAPEIR